MPAHPYDAAIRRWLTESDDLDTKLEHQYVAVGEIQRALTVAQSALIECQEAIERLAAPSFAEVVEQDAQREIKVDEPAERLVELLFTELAERNANAEPKSTVAAQHETPALTPRLLRLASRCLQQLWDQTTIAIGWDDPMIGPYVLRDGEHATSFDDLAPNQQQTFVLSLQLALVRCLTERVGHLPVVLTDRSFDADDETVARLTRLLHELAATGQQIFVVTVSGAVCGQFRRHGVPTLIVSRHVHQLADGLRDEPDDRARTHMGAQPVSNRVDDDWSADPMRPPPVADATDAIRPQMQPDQPVASRSRPRLRSS